MKRFLPFIIIAFAAALTIGGGVLVLRSNKRQLAAEAAAAKPASATKAAPQHVRGPANAPVTLEEFGDFQCPSCAVTAAVIRSLEEIYGDKLRVVFWQFPLLMHLHAHEAALAAEAAGRQGHFWEMHDLLYKEQVSWRDLPTVSSEFERFAKSIGLNLELFEHDMAGTAVPAAVEAEHELGVARGVKNTPTLFINGIEFPPPFSPERLREAIDAAVRKAGA